MKGSLYQIALMLFAILVILPVASGSMVVEVTKIRESPRLESNVIGALKRGEIVVASEPLQGNWLMVVFNNRFGYVYGKYVKIVKTDSSTKI